MQPSGITWKQLRSIRRTGTDMIHSGHITLASPEHHGILKHLQFNYLFNSMFMKQGGHKAPYYCAFVRGTIHDWWMIEWLNLTAFLGTWLLVDSLQKEPGMQKAFPSLLHDCVVYVCLFQIFTVHIAHSLLVVILLSQWAHVATYHTQVVTYNRLLCQNAEPQNNGCFCGTSSATQHEIRHRL